MKCSDYLILDQGQAIKYFCRISLVMYLVYYSYSNAGPECQARSDEVPPSFKSDAIIINLVMLKAQRKWKCFVSTF